MVQAFPLPPEGYKYKRDILGNETSVLVPIDSNPIAGALGFVEGVPAVPIQSVTAETLNYANVAQGNLTAASGALSSLTSIPNVPTDILSEVQSASGSINIAENALASLTSVGSSSTELLGTAQASLADATSALTSATGMLSKAATAIQGQLAGAIGAAKDAIGAASEAIGKGIKTVTGAVTDAAVFAYEGITGAVSDAISGAKEKLTEIVNPTFKDTMNSIKDSSIFKDIKSSLSSITETASSLQGEATAALAALQADIAKAMDPSKLSKEMSLAQAAMDLKVKELISEGKAVTQEALDSAAGNLKMFTDMSSMLKDKAASAASAVTSQASAFGLSANATQAEVGAALESFKASIPSQTIPDPTDPALTIPNPEYTSFMANPANTAKLAAESSITSSLGSVTSSLSSSFNSIKSAADTARNNIVADLKASAFAGQLANSATGAVASVKSAMIDSTKVDALNIAKTMKLAAISNPAVPPKSAVTDAKVDPSLKNLGPTEIPKSNEYDKVYKTEVLAYFNTYVKPTEEAVKTAKAAAEATSLYSTNMANKQEYKKLRAAKPDVSTWSDEDRAIEAKYDASLAAFMASAEYIAYGNALKANSDEVDNYNGYVYKAWETNASRNTIPSEVRAKMANESAYQSYTKKQEEYQAGIDRVKAASAGQDVGSITSPVSADVNRVRAAFNS